MPPSKTDAPLAPHAADPVDVGKIPVNDPIRLRGFLTAEMKARGFSSIPAFARACGVVRQTLSDAVDCPRHDAEIAWAKLLGCEPHHIWPKRYSRDGKTRLHRSHANDRRRPKDTAPAALHNV
jgi:lambda repressor-like predicted transcriptional regulator